MGIDHYKMASSDLRGMHTFKSWLRSSPSSMLSGTGFVYSPRITTFSGSSFSPRQPSSIAFWTAGFGGMIAEI